MNYPTESGGISGSFTIDLLKKIVYMGSPTPFHAMASIGQKPVFLDDAATLQALASKDFRPRDVVYLPSKREKSVAAEAGPGGKDSSPAEVTASACRFETEASHPTMLVVAQTWYHCWWRKSMERAAPLLRANYAFQSLPVPAGRHEVRLAYKDTIFHVGAIVSLLVAGSVRAGRILSREIALNLGGAFEWPMPPHPGPERGLAAQARQLARHRRAAPREYTEGAMMAIDRRIGTRLPFSS